MLMMSGLGISSSSGGTEALGSAARPFEVAVPIATAVWEQPRPLKKELWWRRLELALPLLKEVQASVFCPDADPYTPGRTTRAAKGTAGLGVTKETAAENLLLRTPGLAAKDLEVDDQAVEEHRGLFDSPLHEYHINVTAELFGKAMPTRENSRERMGC
ncbi:hypothetical protein D1007_30670 [Hordeum vulgare]|nr:hypothetical protein D1007_30670 [Hordeum vulgare]